MSLSLKPAHDRFIVMLYNNIICISMGGQLDGNFLPGSLPHKFILIVTIDYLLCGE